MESVEEAQNVQSADPVEESGVAEDQDQDQMGSQMEGESA